MLEWTDGQGKGAWWVSGTENSSGTQMVAIHNHQGPEGSPAMRVSP